MKLYAVVDLLNVKISNIYMALEPKGSMLSHELHLELEGLEEAVKSEFSAKLEDMNTKLDLMMMQLLPCLSAAMDRTAPPQASEPSKEAESSEDFMPAPAGPMDASPALATDSTAPATSDPATAPVAAQDAPIPADASAPEPAMTSPTPAEAAAASVASTPQDASNATPLADSALATSSTETNAQSEPQPEAPQAPQAPESPEQKAPEQSAPESAPAEPTNS